ncbi:MAG: OmpA family protein [Cecembia sp.]
MFLPIRKVFFIAFSLFYFLFFQNHSHAQNAVLRYADKQYYLENYYQAAEAYKKAYNRKSKYGTAVKLAETLDKFGAYDEAYEWWTEVINFPESTRLDYSKYLNAALKVGKWEQIDELLEKGGYTSSDFPELNIDQIRKLSESPSKVNLVPVEVINSDASEIGITFDKGNNILFSSDRGTVGNGKPIPAVRLDAKNDIFSKERSDFNEREFYKIYRKNPKGDLSPVPVDLVDAFHITDPHYFAEKDLIFYTAIVAKTKVKGKKNLVNHAGIYFGKMNGSGKITDSKAFPYNDHLSFGVMNPFVDKSSNRLYFASDMPGGQGGFDIYYSEFDDNLNFSKPVNLGPRINTPHNESHPSIHGGKFYFSSRGHTGFGGIDLFEADYSNGYVDNVQNMGLPFNSTRDDFFFVMAENGNRYLTSDRKGGRGLDDIYTFEELNKFLKVIVEDCNGETITEYEALLVDNLGNPVSTTLNKDGYLIAELEPESDYILNLEKQGYFKISQSNLTTIGLEGDTLMRKYTMAAIPFKSKLFADNIYYDFDKSDIRDSEKSTLDNIGKLLMENPHTILFVNSHTDSRGSNAYNDALSERRAQAVYQYLQDKGIASDRIKLEWFGEENLVNNCTDGVPCAEINHQLNRRSELVLSAFVDEDMSYELPEVVDNPCDLLLRQDVPSFDSAREVIAEDLDSKTSTEELPTIYFDFDRSDLRAIHQKELDEVFQQMKNNASLRLTVEGHTDQRGNEVYNEYLSERRAKAVVDYLIHRGIAAERIDYAYFGKTRPIHDCDTQNCSRDQHQENRRTTLRWNNNSP